MAETGASGKKASGSCPQCDKTLRYSERFFGRQIRCPECRAPVLLTAKGARPAVPELAATTASPEAKSADGTATEIPSSLIFAGFAVCAMIAWIVVALAIGEMTATLVVGGITGIVALIVYGPRAAKRLGEKQRGMTEMATHQSSADGAVAVEEPPQQVSKAAAVVMPHGSKPVGEETRPTEISPDTFDPVEIRPATRPRSADPKPQVIEQRKRSFLSGSPKSTDDDVRFCGMGTIIELDGFPLKDGLVYVVDGDFRGRVDASLIQLDLARGKKSTGAPGLPYWPEYAEALPNQRRRYIEWLTTGKNNPDIELGYPFLYFYGLERRAFVDEQDHEIIIREVLRLLPIYGYSRSFLNYATDFLWAMLLQYGQNGICSEETVMMITTLRRAQGEATLSALLAVEYQRGRPLPSHLAMLIAENDDRSPRSVVIKRHQDEFLSLFHHKYQDRFGEGMTLKVSKRAKMWRYHPASPTLLSYDHGCDDRLEMTIPNVLGLPSQFKPLVAIWTECIAELKDFSREHRKSGGEVMTAAMYESLPPSLREDDHPDNDAWLALLDEHRDERGHAIVPVSALADLREIAPRTKLLKKQGEGISATAECMNLAIEPDPVLTGQRLAWDDYIAIYPVNELASDTNPDAAADYRSAALLLNLGVTIASSDGVVDPEEMQLITEHLEERFDLSDGHTKRLEHLGYLLERHPEQAATVPKSLKEQPEEMRQRVGEYLVAVAAADGIVTTEELQALRKLYKKLALETDSLLELAGVTAEEDESSSGDVAASFALDTAKIHAILAETAKVRDLLTEAMLVDDEESDQQQSNEDAPQESNSPEESFTVNEPAPDPARPDDDRVSDRWSGLTTRYHAFADALVARPEWSLEDVEALAKRHKLMPSGAIEILNDWSLDTTGDWLIDDSGDTVVVSQELLVAL